MGSQIEDYFASFNRPNVTLVDIKSDPIQEILPHAVRTSAREIEVDALVPQAWMGTRFPYWEGPVKVQGSTAGRGYLEMTGYAAPLQL